MTQRDSFGANLKAWILRVGLGPIDPPIEGCTEDEIESVKEFQNVTFIPEIYRQFLLYFGHGAGSLLRGSDYSYEWLSRLKKFAIGELQSEAGLTLPQDALV